MWSGMIILVTCTSKFLVQMHDASNTLTFELPEDGHSSTLVDRDALSLIFAFAIFSVPF